MNSNRKIELLAPAKNAEIAIEAIKHGADAVYIGADKFSARSAAGNSIEDIKKVVDYAHKYWAKVYVATNTILNDFELIDAVDLISQLYDIGVDAIIVQDLGILKMQLPPIELHASTQMDIRNVEKAKWIEECGMTQMVLARELNLKEIKQISSNVNSDIEIFVNGALCYSYSGQCYISQYLKGRSANRGECAQICRLPYDLIDADDNVVVKNKHLLSLLDLDRSLYLKDLIEAGVTSFKIEGRLKDMAYVKNVTAYYRERLDSVLQTVCVSPSSSGKSAIYFEPNLKKSFNRGTTPYFIDRAVDNASKYLNLYTPKSVGEEIGRVGFIATDYFTVNSDVLMSNGDGVCFLDANDRIVGLRVNKVEGKRVYPRLSKDTVMPQKGTVLYRNYDMEFDKILSNESAKRTIEVYFEVNIGDGKLVLSVCDEDNVNVSIDYDFVPENCNNPEKMKNGWFTQLSKLGDTEFEMNDANLNGVEQYFVPVSKLAQWRRELIDLLRSKRLEVFNDRKQKAVKKYQAAKFPFNINDYRLNIHNIKSKEFYAEAGVQSAKPSFEKTQVEDAELMRGKVCVKYELGYCQKRQKVEVPLSEPLYIRNGVNKFRLVFDCKNCEMVVTK